MLQHKWIMVIVLMAAAFGQEGQVSEQKATPSLIYCPQVERLTKDPVMGKWSTQGGWYSQEYSFASQLDAFNGAIYQGDEIGRVTCQYSSSQTGDRLIVLKNTMLVQLPKMQNGDEKNTSSKWQKAEAGNGMECKTNQLGDCPFMLYTEQAQKQDINQTILMLPQN